jgi:hypothetical protein
LLRTDIDMTSSFTLGSEGLASGWNAWRCDLVFRGRIA